MSPRSEMRKLPTGQLESAVMEVLWDHDDWMSTAQVRDALRRPLAYTTVLTILSRLWDKERLERTRVGRSFHYRTIRSREEDAADRMSEILLHVADRPEALTHFVEELAPRDRDELERVLRSLQAGS